jgi:hypothetical protein
VCACDSSIPNSGIRARLSVGISLKPTDKPAVFFFEVFENRFLPHGCVRHDETKPEKFSRSPSDHRRSRTRREKEARGRALDLLARVFYTRCLEVEDDHVSC